MFAYEHVKKLDEKNRRRAPKPVNQYSNHALAYIWDDSHTLSGSAVVQCAPKWKSQTLENETREYLRAQMEGRADFYKREYGARNDGGDAEECCGEGVDFYDEDEVLTYLSEAELKYYQYAKRYDKLRQAGLASTIHHMVSRERLSQFYDMLNENQKRLIVDLFGKQDPIGGDDSRGGSPREILLSLRSNLVLGPDPANRSDDPAHGGDAQQGSFDQTGGEYAGISNIYRKVDELIAAQQGGAGSDFVSGVFLLLSQAENCYRQIQRRKGLDPDMLNLDIEHLWGRDADGRWHKNP